MIYSAISFGLIKVSKFCFLHFFPIFVLEEPGETQKTRTFFFLNSLESVLDNPKTACFDEQYAEPFLKPV